jgi:hypothetical protein
MFLPGVKYRWASSCKPTLDLKITRRKFARAVLPKLGYYRQFPVSIVYTPVQFGGIDLQDMNMEHGIAHTTFVIWHLHTKTEIATSLYILLESYMLMVSTTTSPLQDGRLYTFVDDPWLAPKMPNSTTGQRPVNEPGLNHDTHGKGKQMPDMAPDDFSSRNN